MHKLFTAITVTVTVIFYHQRTACFGSNEKIKFRDAKKERTGFSLAVRMLHKMLVLHIRIPEFVTQFWLLTPALC